MEEAYSREESSIGWWPLSEGPGPSFYAYTYPEPAGFRSATVRPAEAFFDAPLGEFLLPYPVVVASPDPRAAILDFLRSTYDAGARLLGWPDDLTRFEVPGRPRRKARSSAASARSAR